MTEEKRLRVLVLEDDEFLAKTLEKSLSQRYTVTAKTLLRHAIEALKHEPFDAIVADFHLTDGHGTSLLEEAQRTAPRTRRILLTVAVPNLTAKEIETRLVQKILMKPCGFDDIKRAIEGVPL